MKPTNQNHFSYHKENEGSVDIYLLAPGVSICFNQIYTNSWTKGDSDFFSDQMLILNFCIRGRCDVSLTHNKYAIVREGQVCISTVLPAKDFYYPGRLYEGIQIYIDCAKTGVPDGMDLLSGMGIDAMELLGYFCGKGGVYLHRMNDVISDLTKQVWEMRKEPELGRLRYAAIRLLHELPDMPRESETDTCFTRSQIAIVREAEALILQDLSRRITAKEMADRFGISESSFKFYVRGILGDSYLAYFRRKRMEKAAELLRTTSLHVIEIANLVGYENQGKFAGVFARVYGVSPTEYRRMSDICTNP